MYFVDKEKRRKKKIIVRYKFRIQKKKSQNCKENKEASFAHQGCIYFIKNINIVKCYYNLK